METGSAPDSNTKVRENLRIAGALLGALFLFLFAINLMVASLQNLGDNLAQTILFATSNPFNGLLIGLLVTAMFQSSSTTTALIVAFVASGSISVEGAIPIIMGANVGTTITSTIVSLGFINTKKEFRRAVAAGTYHDFFNILTVVVLFPLQYYYGFLSHAAFYLADYFVDSQAGNNESLPTHFSFGLGSLIQFIIDAVPNALVVAVFSIALLFSSIIIFRKTVSNILQARTPEAFSKFFFKNQFKSFLWGMLTTAAIRSSTITTSVVVPIVANRITSLKKAAPFILGANIGTTITAFIAVILYASSYEAITIALVHLLFNLFGILIFYPIPFLRQFPMRLANGLGKLTLRYRLIGFVYLLSTFFFIPFALIYFNQDLVKTSTLLYESYGENDEVSFYRIKSKVNQRTRQGQWSRYKGKEPAVREAPVKIFPVTLNKNTLFVGDQMLLFNPPGYCWDGQNPEGEYTACVDSIVNDVNLANQKFDSVYVYRLAYKHSLDSVEHRYFYSAPFKILLQHDVIKSNKTFLLEKLVAFEAN